MQSYQDYFENEEKELKKFLDSKITIAEHNIQLELNEVMLEHIKFAKARIEAVTQDYKTKFKEKMDKIISQKEAGCLSPKIFEFQVKILRKSFENSVKSSIDFWMDHINTCWTNIK